VGAGGGRRRHSPGRERLSVRARAVVAGEKGKRGLGLVFGRRPTRGVLIGVFEPVVGRAVSGSCHYWVVRPTVLHVPS
jgi:hypothetical protein